MRVGLETLMSKDKEITKGTPGSMNGTFSRRLELGCQKYKIMQHALSNMTFFTSAMKVGVRAQQTKVMKTLNVYESSTSNLNLRCNPEIMTVFLFSIYLMLQGSDGGHRVNTGHAMPEGIIKKLLKL